MSKRKGCGEYLIRIFICVWQKNNFYVLLFCNIETRARRLTMAGGANLVWVEQTWSGWSKFGVGGADVSRTVWRVADNLEKTLLCKFFFVG